MTPTLPPAFEKLPLPPAGSVIASPDGTRLAILDPSLSTLTLYDLAGTVYGQYHDPAGGRLADWWLADSSGVCITSDHSPFSMRIMDRSGTLHPTAFDDVSGPLLSPDGRWIAGTLGSTTATQDVVEIGPRSGTSVRRLPPGSDFLGWLNGQMAYVANGIISLVPPQSGAAQVIAQVPPGNTPREVPGLAASGAMVNSPDEQVLIVLVIQGNLPNDLRLTSAGLTQLPQHIILPGFWVGPHDLLGTAGGSSATVTVVDALTGALVRDTGASIVSDSPQALSGDWLLATVFAQPTQLYAINLTTKATLDLGALPPGSAISALGSSGRFLLVAGSGATYLVDSTKGGI